MLEKELKLFKQNLSDQSSKVINNIYDRIYIHIEAIERTRVDTFGGPVHIGNVFYNVNRMFFKTPKMMEEILEQQRLLLGCAILLHDIGRIEDNKNHVTASSALIRQNWSLYGLPDSDFADTIAEIVATHNGICTKNVDKSRYLRFFEKTIHYGVCCILLRLADELDCTIDRTYPTMENKLIKVRIRQKTPGIEYEPDKKLITISIRPTDICVWNWIPNYEKYLQNMLKTEINILNLFGYYEEIKIKREEDDLIKTSFWTKFISLSNYKKIDVSFIFGMVGENEEPGYGTQPVWKGSSYSVWDILTMINILTIAKSINNNTSVKIDHVIMNSSIQSQISGYKKYLDKCNTILIGSPKMNALSEFILAQVFKVRPFSYEANMNKNLIRFSWPGEDLIDKSERKIPYSTFIYKDSEPSEKIGIYYGTEKKSMALAHTVFPQNDTEEEPDCGLIIIVKLYGHYHIVLSGMSGPGTLASSSSLCECDSCYVLEKEEIMNYLENENQAIFVLVNVSVTRNNNDRFINRDIKSYSIAKVWHYDSNRKELTNIKLEN